MTMQDIKKVSLALGGTIIGSYAIGMEEGMSDLDIAFTNNNCVRGSY